MNTYTEADISSCGKYRYYLLRRWSTAPALSFIMLNPSTADATNDDPTIRRCIGFAKALGCGGIQVWNLFAWRARHPSDLPKDTAVAVGPNNSSALANAIWEAGQGRKVVAAWGAHDGLRGQNVLLLQRFNSAKVPLYRLGEPTKHGRPRHPLMLPKSTKLALHAGRLLASTMSPET